MQDIHTSTWSSYLASGVTLGFWLDFICVLYLAIVIVAFLVIDSSKCIGNILLGCDFYQELIISSGQTFRKLHFIFWHRCIEHSQTLANI